VLISNATEQRELDLVPPFLLIYATAVVLSILTSTVLRWAEDAKHLRPLKAANNSSSLIWRFVSTVVQGPPVLTSSLTAPQPDNETEEKIVREGEADILQPT
jgi:hypothetical protein